MGSKSSEKVGPGEVSARVVSYSCLLVYLFDWARSQLRGAGSLVAAGDLLVAERGIQFPSRGGTWPPALGTRESEPLNPQGSSDHIFSFSVVSNPCLLWIWHGWVRTLSPWDSTTCQGVHSVCGA